MAELTKPDLVQEGMDLLPSYWDDKLKMRGLVQSLLNMIQNPLDLVFEILNGTSLYDAEGNQLDIIGRLWGVDRNGDNDDDYRTRISTVIVQSVADSTPEKIMEIIKSASGATEIDLYEHYPANVHVFVNTYLQEFLKDIGDNIVAVSCTFNIMFPPLQSDKSGSKPSSFEYVTTYNEIESVSYTTSTGATVTPNSGLDPKGTSTADQVADGSITESAYASKTLGSYTVDGRYFFGVFITKDAGATANCLVQVLLTGGVAETYNVEVDITDGSYLTSGDSLLKFRIIDNGSHYFLWGEFKSSDVANTACEIRFYPTYSTTLGTEDITLTGNANIWGLTLSEIDTTQYQAKLENGLFKFTEIIQDTYTVVDQDSNQVVDQDLNPVIATLGKIKKIDGEPVVFSEYARIRIGRPLTEVI